MDSPSFRRPRGVQDWPSYDRTFGHASQRRTHAGEYFDSLEATESYTNVTALTGHASLRAAVMGLKRSASSQEMADIRKRLAESLATGSIGLSTGLNEVPSSYAEFPELEDLCQLVKSQGAFYTSHLRDYKFRVIEAVQEALDLGRATGVSVQLSHLQAVGQKNWHKMDPILELVDQAVTEGVDVGIDAYPYLAGSCNLTQLLPDWSMEEGASRLVGRLRSRSIRSEIAQAIQDGMANDWSDIVLVDLPSSASQVHLGKSIQAVASERSQEPVETALDLLVQEQGVVGIVSFNQSEENLRKVLTHPLTSISTDGLYTQGLPHPRTFGAYPTFLGEFVRDKQWMSLEEAIRKTTQLPARRFRLSDRGTLQVGQWADITVFDAANIGTAADYVHADSPPHGIAYVLVNGQLTVERGALTGEPSGQPARFP